MENMLIKDLMNIVTGKSVPAQFSEKGLTKTDAEIALREQLKGLYDPKNFYNDPSDKNKCFQLIAESIIEELPKRVEAQFGAFVETKVYAVGDKPEFIIKTGKGALRKFVTRVAIGGQYRKGTLDTRTITVDYYAIGGGVRLELEEYLAGKLDMMELREIILDQMTVQIFKDVQEMLVEAYGNLPTNQTHESSNFDEAKMAEIVDLVEAYGDKVAIVCTKKFARTIPMQSNDQAGISEIRNQGYVGVWKGTKVVVLENSFKDETNSEKVLNDQFAFIVPVGKEKLIRHAIEGQMLIEEGKSPVTGAMTWQAMARNGMTMLTTNHFGIYKNTGL